MQVRRVLARGATGVVALACVSMWPATATAGIASSFTGTEGTKLTMVVVDHLSGCIPSNLQSMSINWGDGTATDSSSVSAYEAGDGCDIAGTHTYAEEGSYNTDVHYLYGSAPAPSDDYGTATIADAALTNSAVDDFTVAAGSPVSGTVAYWYDPVPEALSNYTATINWGDGTVTAGTIGSYTVTGSHTYVNGGRYPIRVTVYDNGGSSTSTGEHAYVSGCPTSAPNTPAAAFKPSATTLDGRWVEAIFHDVLGRAPSSTALNLFTNALSLGSTRTQEAMALLTSDEYRGDVTHGEYDRYLHRSPTASETSAGVAFLGAGRDEGLAAQLLGSPGYYSSRGGSSIDGFLGAMYCDTVFRSIDLFNQNNGDYALSMGTSTRAQIAAGVLSSNEYLEGTVNGYYLHYLRRAGTVKELAGGAYLIDAFSDEQMIASLLAGTEYYEIFNPKVAVATTSVAQGGTITTTLNQYVSLTLTVLHIVPHHSQDLAIAHPNTRLVGVVKFGKHHKGRVKLHWNRKVDGRRLTRGRYILLLKAYKGHKLVGVSDALPFTIH